MNQLNSNHPDSHYAVLGVPPHAGPEQIRGRYRELARQYHPDVAGGKGHMAFQRLTQAYNVLQDPQRRTQYDQTLQISSRQPAAPTPPPARQPKPPAAVLRSPAMQRLLCEAEGDAFAESGQHAEALASYRSALGATPNPALQAKIARQEAVLTGTGGSGPSSPAPRPVTHLQQPAQPFWQRWLGRGQAAGQS